MSQWLRICLPSGKCQFDPWVGKISWRRNGNPLQYCCLGNPMDRGAWRTAVHRIAESQTRLGDRVRTHRGLRTWGAGWEQPHPTGTQRGRQGGGRVLGAERGRERRPSPRGRAGQREPSSLRYPSLRLTVEFLSWHLNHCPQQLP